MFQAAATSCAATSCVVLPYPIGATSIDTIGKSPMNALFLPSKRSRRLYPINRTDVKAYGEIEIIRQCFDNNSNDIKSERH